MTSINVTFGACCNLKRCNAVGYFKSLEKAQRPFNNKDAPFIVRCLLNHVDRFMPNIGLQSTCDRHI